MLEFSKGSQNRKTGNGFYFIRLFHVICLASLSTYRVLIFPVEIQLMQLISISRGCDGKKKRRMVFNYLVNVL